MAVSIEASLAVLLAGCLRLHLATARHPAPGVVMRLTIAAMAIGLILFAPCVGLLGQLIARLQGASAALPAARVANDGRDPRPPTV